MKQKEKCANYKHYKALRRPTCGCMACAKKWKEHNKDRQ